jgi:hypothetical protein
MLIEELVSEREVNTLCSNNTDVPDNQVTDLSDNMTSTKLPFSTDSNFHIFSDNVVPINMGLKLAFT